MRSVYIGYKSEPIVEVVMVTPIVTVISRWGAIHVVIVVVVLITTPRTVVTLKS